MSIKFTKEALAIVSPAQITKLIELDSQKDRAPMHDIEVIIDFSLPSNYLAVLIPYNTSVIFGGIDKDGRMST